MEPAQPNASALGQLSACRQSDKNFPQALTKVHMISRQGHIAMISDASVITNCPDRRPVPVPMTNPSQRPVTHAKRSRPCDSFRIEFKSIPMKEVVVHKRREEVMARRDGMRIAGKMQIDVLHWQHLRSSTSCTATLNAEYRPKEGWRSVTADL